MSGGESARARLQREGGGEEEEEGKERERGGPKTLREPDRTTPSAGETDDVR